MVYELESARRPYDPGTNYQRQQRSFLDFIVNLFEVADLFCSASGSMSRELSSRLLKNYNFSYYLHCDIQILRDDKPCENYRH